MNKSKITILSALIALFLSACDSSEKASSMDCGVIKEFTVDEDYCNQYGLRVETFTVKYPESFAMETQEDYQSSNFVSFVDYDSDSLIEQAINIGYYYGVSESGDDGAINNMLGLTKASLIENLAGQFRQQGIDFKDMEMGDELIGGETHFTARAHFETTEDVNGFKGKYLAQFVFYATESDHGVLAIMTGRKNENLDEYDDFENKSCIGSILKSL